uniref:C2H2-type domain-containing protein n=1 Tax=Mycobacterium sp. (strain JLS) TaxID=164757 RepID=A0A5Q5CDE9_MYCSJ
MLDGRSATCHRGLNRIVRGGAGMAQTQQSPAHQECPDCHALTADLAAHKQWHSRLVHDIATAVDKDVKRRIGAQ